MKLGQEYHWNIVSIEEATPRVHHLYLKAQGERPQFIAGQYLTVKLPGVGPAEGKAYSISSAPHEALVRISIKRIGKFSEALLSLKVGDELITSAPYGFFYPEVDDIQPLVFIVGGIGITPCLSIIKDLLYRGDTRPLFLHYSNQTVVDIAFYNELEILAQQYSNLNIFYYVTREAVVSDGFQAGRISIEGVLENIHSSQESLCFICGAMDFTKTIWTELHTAGVASHQLYTEGFF